MPGVVLAAVLAGAAVRVRATDPVQAAFSLDPPVAVAGQEVNVCLTVSNTGVLDFINVTPSLIMASGGDLVRVIWGPFPSIPVTISAGGVVYFVWTLSPTGAGTIRITGVASGNINSQAYSVGSTAILIVPGPATPTIRILNNVLRPGDHATIVLHGAPSGAVTLTVYDQSGAPLGPVGRYPVALDGNGFGSARFDGTVGGRPLSTGVYWVVASGAADAKAPVLVAPR